MSIRANTPPRRLMETRRILEVLRYICKLTVLRCLYNNDVRSWTVPCNCVSQQPHVVRRPFPQASHCVRQLIGRHTSDITVTAASLSLGIQDPVAGQDAVPLVGRWWRPRHSDTVGVNSLATHGQWCSAWRYTSTCKCKLFIFNKTLIHVYKLRTQHHMTCLKLIRIRM